MTRQIAGGTEPVRTSILSVENPEAGNDEPRLAPGDLATPEG